MARLILREVKKDLIDLITGKEVTVYYSESELNEQNYTSGSVDNLLYTEVCNKTVYFYACSGNYDPEPIKGSQQVIISKGDPDKSIIKEIENDKKDLIEDNIKLKQEVRNLRTKLDVLKESSHSEVSNADLLRRLSNLEKIIYSER